MDDWGPLFVAIAGCAYSPGSYTYPGRSFAGQRVATPCLDVAVDRRADLDDRPVLDYQFGNRCERSVVIDLARVPVVGRTAAGAEVRLAAWDPDGEIVPARLGARQAGGEAIAYASAEAAAEAEAGVGVGVAQVCADVSVLDASEAGGARWVCFAQREVP